MPYQTLRDYLAKLQQYHEVQSIATEVDWNLEAGAIIRRSYDLGAPAPWMQKIKGYDANYQIFGAPIGLSTTPGRTYARLALALDLPPDTSVTELMEEYIRRSKRPLAPILVDQAPCKEIVHLDPADINLLEFPVPMIHHGDGGRYIGTWHTIVTRYPQTAWVNWGMYRLMVHDARTMGGIVSSNQHIGMHLAKYQQLNQPMEFAVAIGTEPVTALVSAIRTPPGVDEAALAGGLRGEPVELIRCETIDLQVPASAEIVIEGRIIPDRYQEEGPFGEYTGFRAGDRAPRPVYEVTAITHRRDPILTVSCMGVPVDDCAVIIPVTKAANILDELRGRGFPVKMAYCPPHGVGHMIFVSTEVPYPGYVRHLTHSLWASNHSCYQVFILPADVDVTNVHEVLWSLATRCHPVRGISQVSNVPGNPLLPFLNQQEKALSEAAAVVYDCTWPKDWPPEQIPEKASFDLMWPQEIQEQVLQRWQEYGYQDSEYLNK